MLGLSLSMKHNNLAFKAIKLFFEIRSTRRFRGKKRATIRTAIIVI